MSKPEFVYVTYIRTTPEKLWQALTSSEFSRRYWFGTELQSDWKVGSSFALVNDGKASDIGKILEADPPRRLSYTFDHLLNDDMGQPRASKVVFVLEPHGDLVKLTLTHEGLTNNRLLAGISTGWPAIISNLKSLLETGDALVIPFSALGKKEPVAS